jgi:hypothetical protein
MLKEGGLSIDVEFDSTSNALRDREGKLTGTWLGNRLKGFRAHPVVEAKLLDASSILFCLS